MPVPRSGSTTARLPWLNTSSKYRRASSRAASMVLHPPVPKRCGPRSGERTAGWVTGIVSAGSIAAIAGSVEAIAPRDAAIRRHGILAITRLPD